MRFSIVKTVFLKELREMMRDRRAMAVMFGVPLVLYPLLTVGLGALTSSKAQEYRQTRYKIALVNPDAAPELKRRFLEPESGVEVVPAEHPWQALAEGGVLAVVELPANLQADLLADKPAAVTIRVDRSRNEAGFAEGKVLKVIDGFQQWVITQRLKTYNAPAQVLSPIGRNTIDIASAGQRMGNLLAQMLPLLVLITGMLGALFPALSATTTERELGTLETLLVTPAGRGELLLAKAALVLLCGILTSFLNVLSMSLVLLHTFSLNQKMTGTLSLNFGSLILTFVAALPALVFFTTCVLIVGMIARTYREANSYATPAMLLPIASLALTIADVKTTPGLLITPIANTTLVMRDVLRGRVVLWEFLLAFASSLAYAGLLMSLAARLFSNEQLVNPAWEPISLKGLGGLGGVRRGGRRPRVPAVDEAIALFFASLLLVFYIQPRLMNWSLLAMLAVTQLALVFGPAALFALVGRWKWRETFKLYHPPLLAILGAALVGVGLVPAIGLVNQIQEMFWPAPKFVQETMEKLFVPSLQSMPILVPLAVGALAGIFEELLYRGAIQSALARKSSPWVAITVAAFLFAAAHMDLHGLPIRMGLGMILGWTVVRTGSIIPAMILHGLYDAAALGVVSMELHKIGNWSQTPCDPWSWVRAAIGLALAAFGIWILLRRKSIPQDTTNARGFDVACHPEGSSTTRRIWP